MAALMSTVSGALNSVATLFTYDLYKRWAPNTSQRRLVLIGRIVTFFGMILAVIWSPLCGHFKTIFQGINAAICYIAPPITVVFVAGVFWKKASSRGSFVTLVTGSLLGLAVFLLDWFKETTGWNIPFMMASFYLACVCTVIMVVVSRLFPEPLTEQKLKLIWKSPLEPLREKGWPGIGNYKLLSVILALCMIVLYFVFTFVV